MKGTIILGKIAGIEIGVHYSWFIILGLITWSLANNFLPALNREWSDLTYWITAVLGALFLFGSVLIHELAHSLVAKMRGFQVGGITLFILGGVSNLQADSKHAKDEFIISAVGPASSLVLAGIFWLALLLIPSGPRTPAIAILIYLAFTNLLLAVFNLIPAFPLDGGRVLRSIIWGVTGNIAKATKVSARGGQIIGVLMIGYGLYQIFQGNALGGVWLAIIGWFLFGVAKSSLNEYKVESSSQGIQVSEVMDRQPQTIGADATVYEAVYGVLWKNGLSALPVVYGDRLIGIVTLTDVRAVPTNMWPWRRVRDVMTSPPLKTTHPEADLSSVLDIFERSPVGQVPITENGRLVGMVSRSDIQRFLNAREGGVNDSLGRGSGTYPRD